jgi:hypothetical protein
VTSFRLDAGSLAPRMRRGEAVSSEPGDQTWVPNREEDTILKCGCVLPWPVVALVGTGGKQVVCSDHGVQSVTGKEIQRCKALAKEYKTSEDESLTLDDFPF